MGGLGLPAASLRGGARGAVGLDGSQDHLVQFLEWDAQVAPLDDVLDGQREKTSVRVSTGGGPPRRLPPTHARSCSQTGLTAAAPLSQQSLEMQPF